jgi:hypothetical protein
MGRLVLCVLLCVACSKADGAGAGAIVAWKAAGLEPGAFQVADGKPFAGGACRAGSVNGIAVTVCEFASADAARRAEPAGLAQLQGTTGLSLAEGKLLLVLADREHKDPHGKTINQIATVFRDR